MAEELLIFVGYSEDAKGEAEAVRELEQRLQEALKRLNKVASSRVTYSSLKIFLWDSDARPGVGGQSYAINPELERAAIAVFVFKERVGRVTWKELKDCCVREGEKRIPVITLFPKLPPEPDRIARLEVAEGWHDLLKKKNELTVDWDDENSRSVTPLEPYRDRAHLKEILLKRLEDVLPHLVRAEKRTADEPDPEPPAPQSHFIHLDRLTDQREYNIAVVQRYRALLRAEARLAFPPELSDGEFLRQAGYLREGRLTVAGVLLFTNQPRKVIPSAAIRCARYDGVNKAAARTRRDCGGPLLSQILEARDFIEENTANREAPGEASMRSRKVYQYPMICVREVLANAACHRDYNDADRLTYVDIFEDRIEIKSSGPWVNKALPEGQTIPLRQLESESVQRNMRLAHAIASVDMMEIAGSGIPSSVKDCMGHGSPEPMVVQRDGYVVVTIYPNHDWNDGSKQVGERGLVPKQQAVPAQPPPSTIPRPPSFGFVARRDAQGRDIVGRLKEELAPGRDRLVTLWGAGGIGKSTLAAQVARELRDKYARRVVWSSADGRVDFTHLSLLDDIATQLGRAELRTLAPAEKEEQVRALVADALVVLDNYETVAEPEQKRIEAWFMFTPCPALFTSRVRVPETVFVPVSAMSREEAAEFLDRLAAQTQVPEVFTPEVRDHIYETAEANPFVMQWVVGQIDLAQEPGAVLEELKHGEGDAARRVFDRSFDLPLLGDDGRDALLALSLFAPSAKPDALLAVAGFNDVGRASEAIKNLSRLWLVRSADGNRRLAVEGLTRTLASARLARYARADEFRRRFASYFLRYVEEHAEPTPENYDALEEEKDNLLGAAESAFSSGDWGSVMQMAYTLARPVDGMLSVRGYWDETIRLGEQALQAARHAKDAARVAGLSHNIGVMYWNRGELAQARQLYDESLEIRKKLGDQGGVAVSLHQLGMLAETQGETDEARRLYDESLAIERKLGNQSGVAISLHQLGVLAQARGEIEEAQHLYEASLEITKRLGDQINVANTLHQLGTIAVARGDLETGRLLYAESLEIKQRLGNQSGIATSLHDLGLLAEYEGDKAEATRLLREALNIWDKLGSPEVEKARQHLARVTGE